MSLFLAVLLLLLTGCQTRSDDIRLELTDAQLDWVGHRIFLNECAGKETCLVHWNTGEAFPSLGIGHFIWYPTGVDGRFVESFPSLVDFMREQSVALPAWLDEMEPLDAPWPDRATFLSQQPDPRAASLRQFLAGSKGVQAEFMFNRAKDSLGRVLNAVPEHQRVLVRDHLTALSNSPGGTYALIDYVNFKGEGLSPEETYKGQGWGLRQVLQEMPAESSETALVRFREAAGRVLSRRAENAPRAIEREQWIEGWLKRLETYREPE